MPWTARLTLIAASLAAAPAFAEPPVFLNALNNRPLEFRYRPDQVITPEVEEFHETGANPYADNEEAITQGRTFYLRNCASCHMPDGAGRIGPNLIHGDWKYDRTHTEVGRFEIIYGGGAGSMQAFGQRLDQDEILKVMAYIDTLAVD